MRARVHASARVPQDLDRRALELIEREERSEQYMLEDAVDDVPTEEVLWPDADQSAEQHELSRVCAFIRAQDSAAKTGRLLDTLADVSQELVQEDPTLDDFQDKLAADAIFHVITGGSDDDGVPDGADMAPALPSAAWDLEAEFTAWCQGVLPALQALEFVNQPRCQEKRSKFVALVECDGDLPPAFGAPGAKLAWIRWDVISPERVTGRFTSLDQHGRIKYVPKATGRIGHEVDVTEQLHSGSIRCLDPNLVPSAGAICAFAFCALPLRFNRVACHLPCICVCFFKCPASRNTAAFQIHSGGGDLCFSCCLKPVVCIPVFAFPVH